MLEKFSLDFSVNMYMFIMLQIQNSVFVGSQITGDYRGDDFTASLTVANPDILNNSGKVVEVTIPKSVQ